MTRYNRRSFLKALGIGGAAAVVLDRCAIGEPVSPEPAELIETIGIPELERGTVVPWSFWGETELGPHVADMEHARLYALQVDGPPPGFQFFIRYLRIVVREDVRLADLVKFLETGWLATVQSGRHDLIEAPISMLFSPLGLPGLPAFAGVLSPQVAIMPGYPFSFSVHGAPFSLTGPPIVIGAQVDGVAIKE